MKQTYQEAQAAELERYYDEEARAEDPLWYCELVIKIGWFAFLAAVGVALAVMLSGCGGQDEGYTVEESGSLEQATISTIKTDNRLFYIGVDKGLAAPIFSPLQDPPCSGESLLNVEGWGLGLGEKQVRSLTLGLASILGPPPGAPGKVCPVNCAAIPGGQRINCLFPGEPNQQPGQYPDYILSQVVGGTTGPLATVNDVLLNSTTRKGRRVVINQNRAFADSLDHGTSIEKVYQWIVCRTIGTTIGLAPTSSNITCMGNQPTTDAQYNARSYWSVEEQGQIRTIFFSRPSGAAEL
jgi:hypothetical protein